MGFQLGKSSWGHSCRWETPTNWEETPGVATGEERFFYLGHSLKTFLERAQHKKLRGLPAPDQLGPAW